MMVLVPEEQVYEQMQPTVPNFYQTVLVYFTTQGYTGETKTGHTLYEFQATTQWMSLSAASCPGPLVEISKEPRGTLSVEKWVL